MLFLLFDLDGDRYALDATEIVEVLALTPTKAIPGAPAWVAGVMMRDGVPVPVIDVPRLALGRAARARSSTRLVLVRYDAAPDPQDTAAHAGAASRVLGLIVERATQTRRIEAAQFTHSGIDTPHARWLGPVADDTLGPVQWVAVQHMLDDQVKALLFPPQELTQQASAAPLELPDADR